MEEEEQRDTDTPSSYADIETPFLQPLTEEKGEEEEGQAEQMDLGFGLVEEKEDSDGIPLPRFWPL